ncbi:putative transcriptional regulator [Paraburkholderia sp. WSM4175]|uniref:hypothetical protein n=1 Tax=Paraburkholderia sp. WSM4175 TaxID=2991072 RepID=UPI003D243D59
MGRVVIAKEQWERARLQWEGEPLLTYADIAENLGITRQSVREHAAKKGWQRRLDLQAVAEKAHAQADSKFTYSAVDSSERAALPVALAAENVDRALMLPTGLPNPPVGMPLEQAQADMERTAVDQRSEVLTRHRKELLAARSTLYASMKAADLEPARRAKVITETMKLLHEAERRAWGLDSETPKPGAPGANVKLTIVRRPGRAPA